MSVSLDTLTDKLDSYLDTKQIKLVRDAYYFAADAHEGDDAGIDADPRDARRAIDQTRGRPSPPRARETPTSPART